MISIEKYQANKIMNNNEEQLQRIPFIFSILEVFHFDISGNIVNEEQYAKKLFNFLTLLIFHLVISGINNKEIHL